MYNFLLNMYLMGKIDEQYLVEMVKRRYLTEEEKDVILATPKFYR